MTCRWCGFEQREGRFCDRCGMALAPAPPAARPEPAETEQRRCRQCGAHTDQPICPGCGVPVRPVAFV